MLGRAIERNVGFAIGADVEDKRIERGVIERAATIKRNDICRKVQRGQSARF